MAHLYDPAVRETRYAGNTAQHLLDLYAASAVFDFCGGMMFQLSLSEALQTQLKATAQAGPESERQPVVFGAAHARMASLPGYVKSAAADDVRLFHGREIRKVPTAAGGMGFVLQLVSATEATDPEGWTPPEREGYDGWGHDARRTWRDGDRLESEGYAGFQVKFGKTAFTLNHRFYLHLDRANQLWLSAEDGCEGYPYHLASKA